MRFKSTNVYAYQIALENNKEYTRVKVACYLRMMHPWVLNKITPLWRWTTAS